MPVAPSYQKLEQVSEPFAANGKTYVNVKNQKTGSVRTVRWYSEKEYAKLYPAAGNNKPADPYYKSQKDLLGFEEKGYIIGLKGDTYPVKDYLKSNGAKYTRWWGWYFKCEEDIPELPEGIETVKILWEPMAKNNEWLKNDDEIKKYIDTLMYDATNSQHIGSIGERIEIEIVIEKIISLENDLGSSKMYLMRDDCGNAFVWTTASSKDWQTGDRKRIRGTVKAHREYRNDKQTVLNRCNEVKGK